MLYLGDKKATLFKGDRRPVSLYLGDKKVTGYEYAEQTGKHLDFEGTYNDSAFVRINGKTVEIGEGDKSPDNPYELKSVGDDGGFDLVSCGRNIWDGSLIEGYIRPTNGEELSWAGYYKTDFIPVPPDTDYTITYTKPSSGTTFWAIYYDINKNYISSQNLAPFTPPFSIKTPIGTAYLRITGATLSMTTLTQIELGSTATPYTPFRGMSVVNFPHTLRSLPDGTNDYIEIDNEKRLIIKNISNAIILNGSNEAWSNPSEHTTTYRLICINWCVDKNVLLSTANSGLAVSADGDYAIMPSAAGTGADIRSICFYSNNWLYIRVEKEKVDAMEGGTVLDKFKNYLNLYPVTLIYQLAEPEITPIECEDVKTYYPYTNIYTISTVQPTLEAKIRTWEE